MGKVIDAIKPQKMGASSVIPYLKGKGVKNEEIKWSGIEEFLQGKKSVTKDEMKEFAAGSMLQIEEVTIDKEETPMSKERQDKISALEKEMEKDIVNKGLEFLLTKNDTHPLLAVRAYEAQKFASSDDFKKIAKA